MSVSHSGSILQINLNAIKNNYNILRNMANGKEVACVVKANAYGLGIDKVAPVLHDAGCNLFFVANLYEAIALRELLPRVNIAVFNGICHEHKEGYQKHNIIPVINTMQQFSDFIANKSFFEKYFLHVDSGMNRLGISFGEFKHIVSSHFFDKSKLKMIMSHLACGDDKSHPKNKEQLDIVSDISKLVPDIDISFCNSYGVFLGDEYHFDVVRPGIALYGGNPCPSVLNPMNNVVKITSNIIQIRNIDSVQTVGYGATCTLKKGSRIAVLPVGYADGYFRNLGNKSYCAVKGVKVPVVGRVSMDLITIDITSIKDRVHVDDEVEILGDDIKLEDLAGIAGTIDYEILTSLGSRYKRVYTS